MRKSSIVDLVTELFLPENGRLAGDFAITTDPNIFSTFFACSRMLSRDGLADL